MARPGLVGVLNVTPDSFSDGDEVGTSDAILAKAEQLIAAGANVIDVGAESTRPGATPLTSEEEWRRLEPVWPRLHALCHGSVLLSLDTRHPETAARALAIGVDWINDVSGYASSDMVDTVKNRTCDCVVMHALSIPADKQTMLPDDTDIVAFIKDWCEQTIERLTGAGFTAERLILDPGIGFGKTAKQSWRLLMHVNGWKPQNARVLIGHSRKSFFNLFSDIPAAERDGLTRLVSAMLVEQGVDYLRVHDVAGHHVMLNELAR